MQQRIDIQPPSASCLIGTTNGCELIAVDDAPDDVGGPIAEEQARQHLDLMVRLEVRTGAESARRNAASRLTRSRAEIGEAALQPEVEHDVDQRVAQPVLARIVRAV